MTGVTRDIPATGSRWRWLRNGSHWTLVHWHHDERVAELEPEDMLPGPWARRRYVQAESLHARYEEVPHGE